MNPQEIRDFLRASPFVPFRVYTSDGQKLDIQHPEMAFVTRSILYIGKAAQDPTKDIPSRAESVSMLHVVRLEPLVAI